MKVHDKVFLVTGAGSGIGRELVLHLLSKGARVAGVDLNPKALQETEGLAESHKTRFASFVANISDRPAVDALPAQVLARFGCVDGIINNAGIVQPFARICDLDFPVIERVFNVNLMGTLYMIKAFLPHLLQRPEAHLVNISSMGGFVPVPGQTIYGAAKAAVKLMSEGLSSELIHTNVHVTVVFPGAVATNILTNSDVSAPRKSGQKGTMKALPPSKAAQIIVRGIERDAFQVFVGKDAMLMDKLYRLNPAFAARTIAKKMNALLPA
ncbi:MAG: SDR family NAD(P)-dependent oxidoreductase [Bryobacteraceae bacterium]